MSSKSAELARVIDHTLLAPDATTSRIDRLCDEAREHGFASVCVHGAWVDWCVRRLEGTPVAVCAVAGFPLGASHANVKRFEAEQALGDGAREIDVVQNIGALKSGRIELVEAELSELAKICRLRGALLKVILENALLEPAEIELACAIAVRSGAHFVKTSTGFARSGATLDDVRRMRAVVPADVGVKAAGGIRDAATARSMLAAGATRLGTSASVAIVTGRAASTDY